MPDPQRTALRLGVVGTGYLGAVHAACMAKLGHEVVAVDVDPLRIGALASGVAPFFEPGLEEMLAEVLPTGRLRFTTEYADMHGADVVFLCVGTPSLEEGRLDVGYLRDAVAELAPHIDDRVLVVGKSTVPVGTAAELRASLSARMGAAARVAWNPEFLREGHAIADTLVPSRLVYGLAEETAEEDETLLDAVYAGVLEHDVPKLVMNLESSELVKGAANAFLATKISFINAIADLCDASGGDVRDVAAAMGLDSRIGGQFLSAGLGFGGGCLPKDIRGFSARAQELGVEHPAQLLGVVDRINLDRRARVVQLVSDAFQGDLTGVRVAVLGFTFKPESDDLRDSPALAVADELSRLGAEVRLHDPRGRLPIGAPMLQVGAVDEAVTGADVVLHMTEWAEYASLDPVHAGSMARGCILVDARNRLDLAAWRAAGWSCSGMGYREPSRSQYGQDSLESARGVRTELVD